MLSYQARALVLVLFSVAVQARAAEDDAIAEANRLFHTNEQHALKVLEEAAERSPHDVAVWVELIHGLDVGNAPGFADRASRTALRLNPDDPALLLARARILHAGPALEVLATLSRIRGHEREAGDLSEQVSLDMSIPHAHQKPFPYVVWAARLVTVGRAERAMQVADAGLTADPKPEYREQLQAIRGVCLALLGRFDECLDAQRAAKGFQYQIPGSWTGAADVLIAKDEPARAIRSFAGRTPVPRKRTETDYDFDGHARRGVYAMGLTRAGKAADAAALLAPSDDAFDQLLLLRVHLLAGKEDKAHQVAQELLAKLPDHIGGGSYGGPLIEGLNGRVSLEGDYAAALRWLAERFPKRAKVIDYCLGSPDDRPRRFPGFSYGLLPTSQFIPKLKASLADAEARSDYAAPDVRQLLVRSYEEAGLFADAAAAVAPLAIDPGRQYASRFNFFAMQWTVLRRRAMTESFFQTDPKALAASRVLLRSPDGRSSNRPPPPGESWPSDDEIEAALTKMGPSVLGAVMEVVGPHGHLGNHRSVFSRVIAALGDEGDAPLLIGALADLSDKASQGEATAVLREALPRLTKVRPPPAQDEIEFWNAWWRANAARIVNNERVK